MRVMSEAEWKAFLTEQPRTAKLATVRADGRPHVAPIWIDLDDDGAVVFTTFADSLKGKSIRRDARVCAGRAARRRDGDRRDRGKHDADRQSFALHTHPTLLPMVGPDEEPGCRL